MIQGIKFHVLQLITSTGHTGGAAVEGHGPGAEDLTQDHGQGDENIETTPHH